MVKLNRSIQQTIPSKVSAHTVLSQVEGSRKQRENIHPLVELDNVNLLSNVNTSDWAILYRVQSSAVLALQHDGRFQIPESF